MWERRDSIVPKGFLRYRVLTLLNTKRMSGSEIMSELEARTNGRWKPSPGSIYPLLAWLQNNSYIEESGSIGGVKRYQLTDAGSALLRENEKAQEHLQERFAHLGLGLGLGGLRGRFSKDLHRSMIDLTRALAEYNGRSMKNGSEADDVKVKETLDVAAQQIRDITKGEA